MKKFLQALLLTIILVTSTRVKAQYYRNFGPAQPLMDSIFDPLTNVVPPAHNLLFEKAVHPSYFLYCDGDLYTDTATIQDVYQYYTEVIDMNTNGVAGYEQFTPLVYIDSVNTEASTLHNRNCITYINYVYEGLRSDSIYTKHIVDTTFGLFKPGWSYYADSLSANDVYLQSRIMAASPAYNEFERNAPLWFNPATYYGNDAYSNYSPIINFGTGWVKYNWNDTVRVPNYIDTAEVVIQIGLVKPRGETYDTLYANSYLKKRPFTTYVDRGDIAIPLATLTPKPITDYIVGGKICGIPHEQPVQFTGTSVGGGVNQGYFTISYGKEPNGTRRTSIMKPTILVDGVDFGTKSQPVGWNKYLNQCGGTGYFSFKYDLEMVESGSKKDKHGESKEHYVYGKASHDSANTYPYAFRNMPSFIDSINKQGYDFIFLDFPNGADDMRTNAGVLIKLIQLINDNTCNSVTGNCPRVIDNLIVAGASMGGQVARYALTYMEKNNMPHHTKQYIAFDSPHLGANVPIGLQVMMTTMRPFNALTAPITNDMVKRKMNAMASKQLKLLHYESNANTHTGNNNSSSIVYGEPSVERVSFVRDLEQLGNWPKLCEKIAISNGSSNGTKISYINEKQILTDIRVDFWGARRWADDLAQQTCNKIKYKQGGEKALQILGCVGSGIVKGVVGTTLGAVAGVLTLGTGAFTATAYCMDSVSGSVIAKVAPLSTRFFTRYHLHYRNFNQKVLDNAPGGGNDGLASSAEGLGWFNKHKNGVKKLSLSAVWVPGAFFTFIPTTSALALNTQGVANFQNVDFGGNETDRVDNHIAFDWQNFNISHPTKTVFDRVFFNKAVNEQHVEVSYNGSDRELSKISQFMHVARTSQEYWPNGNTPPAGPAPRVLQNLLNTNVQHYNFDTLVAEALARKFPIIKNGDIHVPVGAHIINQNGYLSLNEYAPPALFDTKANNNYINFPVTPTNNSAGSVRLKMRNWQNQNYQVYGCASITVNNLGKFVIGDKDSAIRYTAITGVTKGATITLNQGGTLIINDNSSLTFEKGSNFNYNGGNIILNGDNARLVINAGANINLAYGTTFTVAGGNKGMGKIVFNNTDALKNVVINSSGQNKLKLKGKPMPGATPGFKPLVEINDCAVYFSVDSAELKTMQINYTGNKPKLYINNAHTFLQQVHLIDVAANATGQGVYMITPKSATVDLCKGVNMQNALGLFTDNKIGAITSKFSRNTLTNCATGITQIGGGISANNNSITAATTTPSNAGIVITTASLNNTFISNTIRNCANYGISIGGTLATNNYLESNTLDNDGENALYVFGCNNLVMYCNTFKNSTVGVNVSYTTNVIAEVSFANYAKLSGYNKFINNYTHLNVSVNNVFMDGGYNTFSPTTGGKTISGGILSASLIAGYNKWGDNTTIDNVFQTQFGLYDILGNPFKVTATNNQAQTASCGSHNPPPCVGCRLACTTCTPITTTSFANVASNIATDSVITAITDTARTNTNYVNVASQGSQVVNYNYPSTSSVREKQLVQQAHKYQQLAHAMAISTRQLATSSNYATPTTSVTIADIETALAAAQTQGDSQTVASEQLSKVQALYVAQQYTQALSYVTTVKPSIHAGWLPHLNYWECIVQNAYALSTGAIDFETYTLQTNNCNGGTTIRKRGSGTTATDVMSVTEPAEVSTTLSDITAEDVLLIHPNPVNAGTTLTVTGEGIYKLTLYSSQSVKVMEYTTNISDTEASRTSASDSKSVLEFTAPNTAGVYWLQVDYNNSVPKRYKVVVQ
ncbi:MAG: right-handed parallel beta-helix repeat-containing protein [Bacteroidia bacterium]